MTTTRTFGIRLLVLASLFVRSAAAQTGTLSGTVRHAGTRAPIEGARVRVEGTSYGDITRANGTFSIPGVPPGTFLVSARHVGFATLELSNVTIQIGRTRALSFELRASQRDTTERSEFSAAFVDRKIERAASSFNSDQLVSLPALNLSGSFGLGGGFLELPRANPATALADYRRGVTQLMSMRGARPEATRYLLDGIDVSNPVFGTLPLLLDPLAVGALTVVPGHADAEDGGGVSGLVSQSLREGGDAVHGTFEYQSSAIPGRFAAPSVLASGAYGVRGFVAGPAPFARNTLHFMISANLLGDRARVMRTNLDSLPFDVDTASSRHGAWIGQGDYQTAQFAAKLTYRVAPTVRVTLAGVAQSRTSLDVEPNVLMGDTVAYPSVREATKYFALRAEKRMTRASMSLTLAGVSGDRRTCSIWIGVCIEDRIARLPVGREIPAFGLPPRQTPYAVSGQYWGGERYNSRIARIDGVAQITEHHQIRVGASATTHEIAYGDVQAYGWQQGVVLRTKDVYRAKPVEYATYFQDAIEYDLLTIKFGARFDYGRTGGYAFANPIDPTNGTSVIDVCEGNASGLSDKPFTYGNLRGLAACTGAPGNVLLDSAQRIAQSDDFHRVMPRVAFAPRIAMSFPLTETSGMFLDVGRYTRNPLYHDAFRNTGVGTRYGRDGDDVCNDVHIRPGSTECAPNLSMANQVPDFIGNPELGFEVSEGFEAGFTSQVARAHSIEASFFSTTQSHLPILTQGSTRVDVGAYYGVLTNAGARRVVSWGSATALGASFTLRRRREHAMSYAVNYTWQKSQEIGAVPDLSAENLAKGLNSPGVNRDFVTSRGRSHAVTALVAFQWGERTPVGLGRFGEVVMRNTRISATGYRALGSQNRGEDCAQGCASFQRGLEGTGTLADLLYVRGLRVRSAQLSLIGRVQNVFDASDGIAAPHGMQLARRRIMTGLGVSF